MLLLVTLVRAAEDARQAQQSYPPAHPQLPVLHIIGGQLFLIIPQVAMI